MHTSALADRAADDRAARKFSMQPLRARVVVDRSLEAVVAHSRGLIALLTAVVASGNESPGVD